jgi:hypothetical protein
VDFEVYRTSGRTYRDPQKGWLHSGQSRFIGGEKDSKVIPGLTLAFSLPQGGKKQTRYEIPILDRDFGELADIMMKADPQAAIRAFGKAMQNVQIPISDEK